LHAQIGRATGSPIPPVEALGILLGNRPHTAARAETTGFGRASHRAVDSQPRGHFGSAVGCPAPRKCAPATRFRQWSAQRPSVSISTTRALRSNSRVPIRCHNVVNGFGAANSISRRYPANSAGANRHNRMDERGGCGVSLCSLACTESRTGCLRWRQRHRTFLGGGSAVQD
jgi:hypothetical protein